MQLENDYMTVHFPQKWGGMPMRDSFDILRSVSIEHCVTPEVPYFQSRNDATADIRKTGSELIVRGHVCKQNGEALKKHVYELRAKLEDNVLYLNYRFNVPKTEQIRRSKVWFMTRWFDNCIINGKPISIGKPAPLWVGVVWGASRPIQSITLYDDEGSIEIQGKTNTSNYWSFLKYDKLEVVYGWATKCIEKGVYTGDFTLKYNEFRGKQ